MTKHNLDYSKSKIYRLINRQTGEFYIGSTTRDSLRYRLAHHRSKYNTTTAARLFLGEGQVDIELLENYKCENKGQLLEREGMWINKYPQCVNKMCLKYGHSPTYNPKAYYKQKYIELRDIIKTKNKEYYYTIKDKEIWCNECKCNVKITNAKHNKSKKHIKNFYNNIYEFIWS